MAQFIPTHLDVSTKSTAEKVIYEIIKKDPRTKDWYVFHSLHIENHITQMDGEADFVILSPSLGCFVIEVKGGGISHYNGEWISTNAEGVHYIKDPFKQASRARDSIMKYLERKLQYGTYFGIGIAFPDVIIGESDITYSIEQVFDRRFHKDFFTYLRKLSEYYKQKNNGRSCFRIPSLNQIERIRQELKCEFERIATIPARIDNADIQLIKPNDQQRLVLDKLEFAQSAIVHGPAGTGKTLLAVEIAKRKATVPNTKVALITYTLFLTEYLKRQVAEYNNIDVFSISDFFENKAKDYKLIGDVPHSQEGRNKYYSVEIPKTALKILSIEPTEYDTIVIDEAQDFSSQYLILLSLMLKKHIARGNYYFFGDFVYQGVFDTSVYQQQFYSYIKAMDGTPADLLLTINERNSKAVQRELDKLMGTTTQSAYSENSNKQDDIYVTYTTQEDELKKIEKLLNKLIINEHVEPQNITILSRKHHLNDSVVSKITRYIIREYNKEPQNCITFTSIRKFKGLENHIIIVVDNDEYKITEDRHDLNLLYVAMSRSTVSVTVFESEDAQIERLCLLDEIPNVSK